MEAIKRCRVCGLDMPLSSFHKDKTAKDGHRGMCKECCKEHHKKRWPGIDAEANRRRMRAYYASNRERLLAYTKKWTTENVGKKYEAIRRRQAAKTQATPAWYGELDALVFSEAYHLCAIRKKATGVAWHVDHYYPLRGKDVCGLHVWQNIQVIPAQVNLQKGARLPQG